MLSLQNISKSFGGTRVLQDVSLEIPVGKITALIGPNGAGKTTLFDVVTGAVRQDKGTIELQISPPVGAGRDLPLPHETNISNLESFERARLGISRTFQQVKLCENLTILDHFEMVKNNEDEQLFSNVIAKERKRLWRSHSNASNEIAAQSLAMTEQYSTFLKSFNFDKPLETRVLDLSYGQRKLLDFGLALFRKHSILLLDEPVAGVNQIIRKIIHQQLKSLKTQGETVLLIEHDIEFVRAIADTVIVLDEGKLLTQGTPKEVFLNKQVMEAYLGE